MQIMCILNGCMWLMLSGARFNDMDLDVAMPSMIFGIISLVVGFFKF